MKRLILFFALLAAAVASGQTITPGGAHEATAAQTSAGTAGAPYYLTPRALVGSAPTLTGLWTFAGNSLINSQLGVTSLPSGDNLSTVATDTNEPFYITRTTNNGAGTVSLIQHIFYKTTPVANTQVMAGILVDSDDASSLAIGAGHWANMVGVFTRESSSGMQGWGMEAKYTNKSTANDAGQSLWADTQYNMASATGHRAPGITQTFELFNGTPSSPISTGGVVSYHAQTPLEGGDSTKFVGFWGDTNFAIYNAGPIRAYDTLGASGGGYPDGAPGTNYCYINFNNTDGELGTSSGNLNLKPTGGYTIQNGTGLVPLSNSVGQMLGVAPNNVWVGTFQTATLTTNIVTAGSGTGVTVNQTALVTRTVYKVTTTFAAFSAAAKTADLTIATLPAKIRLCSIICDVTQTFSGGGETAATFTCGHAAGGATLLASFSCFTATTTKGLADADLGSDINRANAVQGGYIGSWSSTTPVSVRLTTTTNNTSALTQGSATWYLICEQMP